MKYKAFISYKHDPHSRDMAVSIESSLKKYALPLFRLPRRIFRDEQIMQPGEPLAAGIRSALQQSEYLIYLASPRAAQSEWIQDELKIWLSELTREATFLIVLIDGEIAINFAEKTIDWEKSNALPPMLREHLHEIPLYLDLKWARDANERNLNNIKYKSAINRIAARFEDKTPEEMNGVEVKVHQKNIRIRNMGIAGILLFALLAIGFGFFALSQKRQAEANLLVNYSMQTLPTDPTVSFRLAQEALQKQESSSSARQALLRAYYGSDAYYSVFGEHEAGVNSAVYAHGGPFVLSASNDSTAVLWNLEGQPLRKFPHQGWVSGAVFSPDDQFILTSSTEGRDLFSTDHALKLWDIDGNLIQTFRGGSFNVNDQVFLPGRELLLTSDSGAIHRLTFQGERLRTYQYPDRSYYHASYDAGKQRIIAIGSATDTEFGAGHIDFIGLDGRRTRSIQVHREAITSVELSPDGKYLLTGSDDHTALLLDTLGNTVATLEGHSSYLTMATFSRNGQYLLTAASDGTARLWSARGELLKVFTHENEVSTAAFSPDGSYVITASAAFHGEERKIRLWSLSETRNRVFRGHRDDVQSAVFSPDGQQILTAGRDSTVRIWQVSGEWLATFTMHQDVVNTAIFSADGQYILTASEDGTAKLSDRQGRVLVTYTGHREGVSSAAFSKDGRYVITAGGGYAGEDNSFRIWQLDGTEIYRQPMDAWVLDASFSYNDEYIITSGFNNLLHVWRWQEDQSPETERKIRVVGLRSARFFPDNLNIVTSNSDYSARVLAPSGEELLLLKGHIHNVNAAAVSPNGRYIATGGGSGFRVGNTVRIWDRSGNCLAILNGHRNSVQDVRFSPDGKYILSAGNDHTVRLWPIDPSLIIDQVNANEVDIWQLNADTRAAFGL